VLERTILLTGRRRNIGLHYSIFDHYTGISRAYTQEARAPLIEDLKMELLPRDAKGPRKLSPPPLRLLQRKTPDRCSFLLFPSALPLGRSGVLRTTVALCCHSSTSSEGPLARWLPVDALGFSTVFADPALTFRDFLPGP
jgi:hypothetical protein